MQIDRSQSPDVIERIGMVIWKIAVLVITLRCALALIPQQGVLNGLSIGSVVLQACAFVLITVGGAWAVVRALRARASRLPRPGLAPGQRGVTRQIGDTDASLALRVARGLQYLMWRSANWMLALGLESLLAAQIIQVSIISAEQHDLSWWRMIVVVVIAISCIVM